MVRRGTTATGRCVGKVLEEEGEGGEEGRRDGSTTKLSRDTGTGVTCQRKICSKF